MCLILNWFHLVPVMTADVPRVATVQCQGICLIFSKPFIFFHDFDHPFAINNSIASFKRDSSPICIPKVTSNSSRKLSEYSLRFIDVSITIVRSTNGFSFISISSSVYDFSTIFAAEWILSAVNRISIMWNEWNQNHWNHLF